jgi:hypothetical protein
MEGLILEYFKMKGFGVFSVLELCLHYKTLNQKFKHAVYHWWPDQDPSKGTINSQADLIWPDCPFKFF